MVRSFIATLCGQLEKHTYWSRLDQYERKADNRAAESLLFARLANALVPTPADAEKDRLIAKQVRNSILHIIFARIVSTYAISFVAKAPTDAAVSVARSTAPRH